MEIDRFPFSYSVTEVEFERIILIYETMLQIAKQGGISRPITKKAFSNLVGLSNYTFLKYSKKIRHKYSRKLILNESTYLEILL